jgi:superkiller protein 3
MNKRSGIVPIAGIVLLLMGWAAAPAVLSAQPSAGDPLPQPNPGDSLDRPDQNLEDQVPELKEAAKCFERGDFQGAKALLDKAVQKRADLPPAALLMVRLFAQANDRGAVQNWLQQTVTEAPEDPEAYLILADLDFQEGRWAQADSLYQGTLERLKAFQGNTQRKSEMTRRALMGIAAVAEVRGDWSKAQENLEAVLADDPDHSGALQQLARVLFRQDQADLALEKLRQAAQAAEGSLVPEVVLAQLYQQKGDRENAFKWMSAAINANPRDPDTRVAAAQWALAIGQLKQAREQADAALTLKADSLDAQVLRGAIAMFSEDYPTAVKFFQKASLQAPGNFSASNYLALALASTDDMGQKSQAFTLAENNVRKYPSEPEAYSTLGWTLYRTGRFDDAQRAFSTAASMGRLGPHTAYFWAKLNADRGRKEEAIRLLEGSLTTSGPFFVREQAEDLLEQLKPNQQK